MVYRVKGGVELSPPSVTALSSVGNDLSPRPWMALCLESMLPRWNLKLEMRAISCSLERSGAMIIRILALVSQRGFLWILLFLYDRMLSHVVKIQNPRRFPAGYPCPSIQSTAKQPSLSSKQSLSFPFFVFRISLFVFAFLARFLPATIDQITTLSPLSISKLARGAN